MITTSSPSPTIAAHSPSSAAAAASSPHFTAHSHYDGFYRSKLSPHPTSQKLHSRSAPSQSVNFKSPVEPSRRAVESRGSQADVTGGKVMKDAGTQYSPPINTISSGISKTTIASTTILPAETPPKDDQLGGTRTAKAAQAVGSMPAQSAITTTSAVTGSKRTTSHSPIPIEPQEPEAQIKHPQPATSVHDAPTSKRVRPDSIAIKLMPMQYEKCDVRDLVILISSMLMELIRYNDAIPIRDGNLTRFHSRAPPTISVIDYLQRLTTHATLPSPILLSMVYYIDRLCALYPAFTISSLTVHRFLITSATVASKGLSDSFWTNKLYARVGGVSLKELALLELEFLWRVDWRIVPRPEVLVDYYRSLVERTDGYEIDVAGELEKEREASEEMADKG